MYTESQHYLTLFATTSIECELTRIDSTTTCFPVPEVCVAAIRSLFHCAVLLPHPSSCTMADFLSRASLRSTSPRMFTDPAEPLLTAPPLFNISKVTGF
jgi:hypothetical protein